VLFLDMLDEVNRHSARDVLPTIRVPTLVVSATGDGFTPLPLAHAMRRAIPAAEMAIVRDGSHTCPIERPAFVDAAVVDFLRRRVDPLAA
jgi:pimeloyl-ACP methyl ester carboxylesterase